MAYFKFYMHESGQPKSVYSDLNSALRYLTVIGEKVFISEEINNTSKVLGYIAWTKGNLFVGPSASYRVDDASQGVDEMPMSMNDGRKAQLKLIINAYRSNVESVIPHERDRKLGIRTVSINENKLCALVKVFITALYTLETTRQNVVHDSIVSDWGAVPGTAVVRQTNAAKRVFFTKGIKQPVNYKLQVMKNSDYAKVNGVVRMGGFSAKLFPKAVYHTNKKSGVTYAYENEIFVMINCFALGLL